MVADARLRQTVVLYVLPGGVVELGGTGGLGVVLRVCLQSCQPIETHLFEIRNYIHGMRFNVVPSSVCEQYNEVADGFTFLVPAHTGSPGKGPLNGCVRMRSSNS